MASTSDHADWMAAVDGDIATLKQAGVQPTALVIRLRDARNNAFKSSAWREFRGRGRGLSNCNTDGGIPTVILEFTHRAHAGELRDELEALRPRFKAITGVEYREHGKDGATISVKLPPMPTDAKECQ